MITFLDLPIHNPELDRIPEALKPFAYYEQDGNDGLYTINYNMLTDKVVAQYCDKALTYEFDPTELPCVDYDEYAYMYIVQCGYDYLIYILCNKYPETITL